MDITIQNKNNRTYEKLLNELILDVFGFTFAGWHSLNVWDERYESYSVIVDGTMLSNICVYRMDLLVNDQPLQAIQLGAVGTRKEHRKKGLSRRLMECILQKYDNTPAFLFGDDSALDFYPKFGFERTAIESLPRMRFQINNSLTACRLSVQDSRLWEYLDHRKVFSRVMDCTNTSPVNLFYLRQYTDLIYEIAPLEAVVVAAQDGSSLRIKDIIAKKKFTFEQLAKYLPFSGIERIEFGFTPDWLDTPYSWEDYRTEGTLFIRGDLGQLGTFKFPDLSKT